MTRTLNKQPQARGIQQQIAAFHITVKPDYDRIVAALRKFEFPTLYTLDDLVATVDWRRDPTRADRVHLSRALRRAGVEPLRGKKIMLTDPTTMKRIRAYVWCIGNAPDFRSAGDVRREYYRQRHVEKMRLIQRIQQQIIA